MSTVLDIAVTILMGLAAIMQLAVIRDQSVLEHRTIDASRWLLFGGYAMLFVKFLIQLVTSFEVQVSDFSSIALCLISMGHIAFCWIRLSKP